MLLQNKVIYIISPEAWGKSFVSKHHYASLLAEKGNKVYFINPPSDQWQKKEVKSNLTVIDYKLGLYRGLNRMPGGVRNALNSRLIKQLKRFIIEKPEVVWSFDPFRFQNLKSFKAKYKIYHPVDVHQTPLEQIAVNTADVVFSTAHKILERFDPNGRTPQHFITHGVANHFVEKAVDVDFKVEEGKINVGYVGNMNYQYLDKGRLSVIVQANPEVNFYFIGPYEKSNLSEAINADFIKEMQTLDNAFILGPKPSKELPAYIQQMDLFLMCYTGDINPAQMANPHKILEYLSTGKPVITHFIDEYKEKKEMVWMVKDNKDLPKLFNQALKELKALNQESLQEKRKAFALDNTYEKQLNRIETYLKAAVNE